MLLDAVQQVESNRDTQTLKSLNLQSLARELHSRTVALSIGCIESGLLDRATACSGGSESKRNR